jgi:hypothetical protein
MGDPCLRCGGPIDEHIKALTDGIRRRRGMPLKAPKLCTRCAWMAMTTIDDDEGESVARLPEGDE